MNWTGGIQVGLGISTRDTDSKWAVVCGDHLSVGRGTIGTSTMGRQLVFVIGGTAPGILFCVHWECVLFLNFNAFLVVGFGAAIIGGASVMWVSAGCGTSATFTPCSSLLITLCSTLCAGGGRGSQAASFFAMSVRMRPHLSGGSLCNIVTRSSMIS
jgi:hypothetical protein